MKPTVIKINNNLFSRSEILTIQVALNNLLMDLLEDGLGDDEIGKGIARGYLQNIEKIQLKLIKWAD